MSTTQALRIAALQLPHRYGKVSEVLARVDRELAGLRGTVDLVLLPECAITGYVSSSGDFDLTRFAEPIDGATAAALASLARSHGVSLAGPLVERDGARCFNSLVLFDAAGTLQARWRKRHPWYPERWATPGDVGTSVVEHRGLRVTACVCFDVHFVGDDAPGALMEADVLLFPSAWVDDGEVDARDELLPALARRFGVTVVNANWGRGSAAIPGQGGSRIVRPDGTSARIRDGDRALVATVDVRTSGRGAERA